MSAITAAVAVFLFVQLDKWPPHEDETLPLFVGRHSLSGAFDIVLAKRGGAPLHFLLAWIVAHTGGGLHEMRLLSAVFAVASIPAIAILGQPPRRARARPRRDRARCGELGAALSRDLRADVQPVPVPRDGLVPRPPPRAEARRLGRLGALGPGDAADDRHAPVRRARPRLPGALRRRHPRALAAGDPRLRGRRHPRDPALARDLVLADRYDVGGSSGGGLRTPHQVFAYLWHVAGDSSAGYPGVLVVYLLLALVGLAFLARDRPRGALLVACVVLTPTLFFLVGKFGGSSAPQSRHLIFVLPFLALAAGSGIVGLARLAGPRGAWLAVAVVAALVVAEVGWGKHKTPALFGSESAVRVQARAQAAEWLAQTARPDDVLFAYEPLYLAAWERHRSAVSNLVVARADPSLLDRALREADKPLGRGVWVFDAGDNNNYVKRNRIELRLPFPADEFEGRAYGPYLVIRTRKPTRTIAHYLDDARKAELIGKSLGMGDADINYATIRSAQVRELVRSRSSVSS